MGICSIQTDRQRRGDARRHSRPRTSWLAADRARRRADPRWAVGLRLRSAAYLGWRLPTLNELFRPFRAGADATAANADLDPERLRGAEAGY